MLSRAFGAAQSVVYKSARASSSAQKLTTPKKLVKSQKLSSMVQKRYAHYNLGEISEVSKFPHEAYAETSIQDTTSAKTFGYFVIGSSTAGLAVAGTNIVMPFLTSLSAARDVVAMANIELDISKIPEGEAITVKWRGKPLFIRHRTPAEIEAAAAVPLKDLPDPQEDKDRVRGPSNILILLGICTHLGCVPLNGQGNYGGWFCPCHGSHYDTSGRIRKGPAPRNLEIPPYYYLSDTHVLVGLDGPK